VIIAVPVHDIDWPGLFASAAHSQLPGTTRGWSASLRTVTTRPESVPDYPHGFAITRSISQTQGAQSRGAVQPDCHRNTHEARSNEHRGKHQDACNAGQSTSVNNPPKGDTECCQQTAKVTAK
jgi:hypothetical protein